jgi:hypothetical protein
MLDKILADHPDILWFNYNLDQLKTILDRKGWKKSITDIGQFVRWWNSDSEKSLYAQVKELALPTDPDEIARPEEERQKTEASGESVKWLNDKTDLTNFLGKFNWTRQIPTQDQLQVFRRLKDTDPDWRNARLGDYREILAALFIVEQNEFEPGMLTYQDWENIVAEAQLAIQLWDERNRNGMEAAIKLWRKLQLDVVPPEIGVAAND